MMDFSGVDLSTTDPNPTLEDPSASGDTASTIADYANVAAQWGTVIGSIVSGTPVASRQQPDGSFEPFGPAPRVVPKSGPNWPIIAAVIAGVVIVAILTTGKSSK